MQFDSLLAESRITLTEAARECGVNVSTVWRWAIRGVRGTKLESFNLGAKRFTTREALKRFSQGCTSAANRATDDHRTNRQRAAEISQAEHECANAGF